MFSFLVNFKLNFINASKLITKDGHISVLLIHCRSCSELNFVREFDIYYITNNCRKNILRSEIWKRNCGLGIVWILNLKTSKLVRHTKVDFIFDFLSSCMTKSFYRGILLICFVISIQKKLLVLVETLWLNVHRDDSTIVHMFWNRKTKAEVKLD